MTDENVLNAAALREVLRERGLPTLAVEVSSKLPVGAALDALGFISRQAEISGVPILMGWKTIVNANGEHLVVQLGFRDEVDRALFIRAAQRIPLG